MRRTLLCSTLLAFATACPADPEGTTADTTSSESSTTSGPDATTSTTGPDGSSGDAPTTGDDPTSGSTGDTSGDASTGAPAGVCGDGVLDDGEACDDGNDAPEDGCEACQPVAHVDWTVELAGDAGDHDRAHDVAITPDGTILVVGYQDGNAGVRRPVIVALAPDGSVLAKYVHPTDTDLGIYESIVVAADGSYYVAGTMTIAPNTATSATLHKFSPDHTLEWTHDQAGPDGNASGRGVALADDAVYTAGAENGVPTRMFVRRHALDGGAIEWEWNGPDPEADAGARAVAVAGERVIVVGHWQIQGEDYPLAAALDHQGNKITHVTINLPGEYHDVTAIGDEVVIAGWQVPLDGTPLLWRTDLDLGSVWHDVPEHDGRLYGVAADPTRGIVVAGILGIPDYDADVHVGLHSGAGEQLWTTGATGMKPSGNDRGDAVAFGPHSFVAVGSVGGPDGTYDWWIRRVLFG
jgi:cysteine-rich repeat protein